MVLIPQRKKKINKLISIKGPEAKRRNKRSALGFSNTNKVQWKQGTKVREQSKQGKTRNKGKGDRPGKVYFFTTKT